MFAQYSESNIALLKQQLEGTWISWRFKFEKSQIDVQVIDHINIIVE